MSDKEIIDLLGLTDKKINVGITLEDDLQYVIDNGIEKYLQKQQEHENKKKEFMEMFRECFQEIVHEFEKDPKQQIAVNCLGCRCGGRVDLSHSYAKRNK